VGVFPQALVPSSGTRSDGSSRKRSSKKTSKGGVPEHWGKHNKKSQQQLRMIDSSGVKRLHLGEVREKDLGS